MPLFGCCPVCALVVVEGDLTSLARLNVGAGALPARTGVAYAAGRGVYLFSNILLMCRVVFRQYTCRFPRLLFLSVFTRGFVLFIGTQ